MSGRRPLTWHLVGSCDLYFAPKGFKESAKQTFPAVETLAAEIGHFAESLINGTRPVHSAQEGRDVLEIVLKAAESADEWQVVCCQKIQNKRGETPGASFRLC